MPAANPLEAGQTLDLFGMPEPAPVAALPVMAVEPQTVTTSPYTYRLDCNIKADGPVHAYFGAFPWGSREPEEGFQMDALRKLSENMGCSRFVLGNVLAHRSRSGKALTAVADPVGPENAASLAAMIAEADVLIPVWGSLREMPAPLLCHVNALIEKLLASGKPVCVFGWCLSGDPAHPMMIPPARQLTPWSSHERKY